MQRTNSKTNFCARVVVIVFAIHLFAGISALAQTPAGSADSLHSADPAAYPLKVSSNGRYLVDRNNMPFLIVGDVPQTLELTLSG